MYGKLFASAFTGSMFGAGPDVFAVWAYAIAHAPSGITELNPDLLAASIGASRERMEKAIEFLCAPDPRSRSKAEDGRRLLREGEFSYRVVNWEEYRGIRSEDERREYNREKQRQHRLKARVNDGQEVSNMSMTVNDSQSLSSVSANTEADTDTKSIKQLTTVGFASTWKLYPKRAGGNSRQDAEKCWKARVRKGVSEQELHDGTVRYAAFCEATGKTGTEYVKQARTFYGPAGHWREQWDIPRAAKKSNGAIDFDAVSRQLKESGDV